MEEDHLEEQEEDISIFQESPQQTLFSYFHQQNLDPLHQDFIFNGKNSGPERMGFSLASPEMKVKRRSAAAAGGARVIRSAAGRKDRHSKVCTARGTRDRRLRLSPKTAIQFYDVQDRLGFDRPSKAIDWLMKEAKAAIDALLQNPSANEAEKAHGKFQESPLFFKSDENPVSGSDFFTNEDYSNGDFNSSSVADLEMGGRLQRIFNWGNLNAGEDCSVFSTSAPPLHFPAPPPEMLSQREPLQSIHNNYCYSPINWSLPGNIGNFITAEEEEKDLDEMFFLHGGG